MNYEQTKEQILDWVCANSLTVKSILFDLNQELKVMLAAEPEFFDEIQEQYKNRVKTLIGEEISRQLGLQIDIIFEVLEISEIQEFLTDDSLCFNDYSDEAISKRNNP
jgi:hypothetical protein